MGNSPSAEKEIVHQAEVELIATRVAEKTAEGMASRMPIVMAPKMYEIAEKVSAQNLETFRTTMRIVLGVDPNSEESIRNYRQDMDWVRDKRTNEMVDRRAIRSAGIKAFVGHIMTVLLGSGFMIWLFQHFPSSMPRLPPGG